MSKKKIILIGIVLVITYAVLFGKETVMKFTKYLKGNTFKKMIPEMQNAVTGFIEDAQSQGIDAMFFEGYRTIEKSQEMIDKGTSQLKNPENSDHVWGIGADIVIANALGFPSWPDASNPIWDRLHEIGRKHNLEFYISWDKPHCRLSGYSVSGLRENYNNPTEFLTEKGVA